MSRPGSNISGHLGSDDPVYMMGSYFSEARFVFKAMQSLPRSASSQSLLF